MQCRRKADLGLSFLHDFKPPCGPILVSVFLRRTVECAAGSCKLHLLDTDHMSDDDDYLSEKFLLNSEASTSNGTKTYAQRRREAQRAAEERNRSARKKSRKEIETENMQTVREGMSTSLFERAKLENEGESKGLKLMSKFGFKPGQTLGKIQDNEITPNGVVQDNIGPSSCSIGALKAPIKVEIWEGGSVRLALYPFCTNDLL